MSELSASPLEHAQPLPGLDPESRALTGHCRVSRVSHLGGSRLIFVLFCFLFFVFFFLLELQDIRKIHDARRKTNTRIQLHVFNASTI